MERTKLAKTCTTWLCTTNNNAQIALAKWLLEIFFRGPFFFPQENCLRLGRSGRHDELREIGFELVAMLFAIGNVVVESDVAVGRAE